LAETVSDDPDGVGDGVAGGMVATTGVVVTCDDVLAGAGEGVVAGAGGAEDPYPQVGSCHLSGKSALVHWHWLLSMLS